MKHIQFMCGRNVFGGLCTKIEKSDSSYFPILFLVTSFILICQYCFLITTPFTLLSIVSLTIVEVFSSLSVLGFDWVERETP